MYPNCVAGKYSRPTVKIYFFYKQPGLCTHLRVIVSSECTRMNRMMKRLVIERVYCVVDVTAECRMNS